jgi:hypothetical protein
MMKSIESINANPKMVGDDATVTGDKHFFGRRCSCTQ